MKKIYLSLLLILLSSLFAKSSYAVIYSFTGIVTDNLDQATEYDEFTGVATVTENPIDRLGWTVGSTVSGTFDFFKSDLFGNSDVLSNLDISIGSKNVFYSDKKTLTSTVNSITYDSLIITGPYGSQDEFSLVFENPLVEGDFDLANFQTITFNYLDYTQSDYGYYSETLTANITLKPIPAPAAIWLFLSGLAGLASFRLRKLKGDNVMLRLKGCSI